MIRIGDELEGRFDSSVSKQIQEALIRLLFDAYRTAHADVYSKFDAREAKDLLGFYRWVQIRQDSKGLAGRFPDVLIVSKRFHTLVTINHIMFTTASAQDPEGAVRHADYRGGYALQSQLDLYEQEKPVPKDAIFYCVLVHGHDHKNKKIPAFAKFAFPDRDNKSYVHEIDLFKRHEPLIKTLKNPDQKPPIRPIDIPERKV